MQQVHDFKQQLAYSAKSSTEPFWDAIYKKAFPSMVAHVRCEGDFQSQRRGVDRLIYLSSDRVLRIDEKKRTGNWPDILLEYISIDTSGSPGWIEKELSIDYLAYAFMPTQRVYLLPWLLLQRSWVQFGTEWKQKYKTITAQNKGYKTLSVAVPTKIVLSAIAQATIIQLDQPSAIRAAV